MLTKLLTYCQKRLETGAKGLVKAAILLMLINRMINVSHYIHIYILKLFLKIR